MVLYLGRRKEIESEEFLGFFGTEVSGFREVFLGLVFLGFIFLAVDVVVFFSLGVSSGNFWNSCRMEGVIGFLVII